jgi:hypothetical protein
MLPAAAVAIGLAFGLAAGTDRADRAATQVPEMAVLGLITSAANVPTPAPEPGGADVVRVDPDSVPAPAVQGFTGDNSQAPQPGTYSGRVTKDSAGDVGRLRSWLIERRCTGSAECIYTVTRTLPDGPTQTGRLVRQSDGWHVTFPAYAFPCRCPGTGERSIYATRGSYVMQFNPDGRAAVAHGVISYRSRECGDAHRLTDWSFSLSEV